MKQLCYLMISVIVFFTGCSKKQSATVPMNALDSTGKYKIDVITKRPTTVYESQLLLPQGTRIQVTKDDLTAAVTLPDGYAFLTADTGNNKPSMKTLPVIKYATYSCKCSGEGSSCSVFYQEQAGGFGCLHKSCSGSCTGSFVTAQFQQVKGVVPIINKEITIPKDLPFTPASLEPGTKKWFFEQPFVQQKIKEQYDIMYSRLAKPDFKKLDAQPSSLKDYVFARVQFYGVDFYLLAPVELSKRTDLFEVVYTSASCKCGASKGGCVKGSGGFLGYRVYWCDGGCNGCQLTISKGIKGLVRDL